MNFEMNLYGPYYSEQQAQFARSLFATKYPNLAAYCSIVKIDLNSKRVKLIDPRLLH
ncbi:hypothetical protein [Mariprofundus ferrooxydans]|uniref:hypothetical protein n=1 Tax=Mariprofundus ferrooxydans TaxID=314344 RepID=UPI0012DD4BA7|nr:hypothetical protein [Mariprofundus ferrooxydans]